MAQSISQEAIGATGLPGATAASRHAGATTSGAPVSGTFAVGDFIVDQSGKFYVCTVAGTPGTWGAVGGASALTNSQSYITSNQTNASSGAFNVTSLSLTSGTWLINAQINMQVNSAQANFFFGISPTTAYIGDVYSGSGTTTPSTANNSFGLSFSYILTLASTTTVYLNYSTGVAGTTVLAKALFSQLNNTSGMNAVKIA